MRSFFKLSILTVALLLMAGSLFGQGTTGTLSGTVTQDGAALPGVTVTATSPNLQGARTTVTNEGGGYTFGALPPGPYSVRFELTGLSTITKQQHVGVAQSVSLNAEMRVSAVTEAITVTASSPAVAETTEVHSNFTAEVIEELPVQRTLIAVTGLAPGVTNGVNGLSISGGNSFDNLYTVNGAVVQENLRGQPHNLFIEDAIQETTVQTAGVSAEFGNFTGGVVSAVTKSGGNDFSGSLRDNLTNQDWTAPSPQAWRARTATADNPATRELAPRIQATDKINHAYEGTLGGRIIRDRLWFFAAARMEELTTNPLFAGGGAAYTRIVENNRFEGKLSAAITPRHNIVASYLDSPTTQAPDCQLGCFDDTSLDPDRELPNDFMTLNYNGVITNNFFIELKGSQKNFAFVGSGGEDTDRVTGTPFRLTGPGFVTAATGSGQVINEPYFCGVCTQEDRNNEQYGAKATYYLGTRSLGNHNIIAGVDRWHETRLANNFQTPSGYVFVSRTYGLADHTRTTDGPFQNRALVSVKGGRDYMFHYFIPQLSEGSDLNTDALYINDKWDLSNRWHFNLGARYDRNDSSDSAGNKIANDSMISPRLGATADWFGDGRLRINASYGVYVGRLAESIAGAGSAAGNNANFAYLYGGPDILKVPVEEALRQVWAWFDGIGGIEKAQVIGSSYPGASRQILGSLKSPNVREYTIGASTQFGNGFLRADIIRRDWRDFYGEEANRTIGTVTLPGGVIADKALVVNTNEFERTYDALELQGSYRLFQRLNIGANYTYSELKGNVVSETTGAGPVTEGTSSYYPEYYAFDQNNPVGFLAGDQTHKLRAWASMDFNTFVGNFNVSVLERFDSGDAYSLVGSVNTGAFITNPGYRTPPTAENYYFSDRGEFRWDDLTATDLAINYDTNPSWLRGVSVFAQAEVVNLFDESAQIGGNSSVLTSVTAAGLTPFNPLTGERPVEGTHYTKGGLFGLPTAATNATTAGHFQLPRTYRFSLGLRF